MVHCLDLAKSYTSVLPSHEGRNGTLDSEGNVSRSLPSKDVASKNYYRDEPNNFLKNLLDDSFHPEPPYRYLSRKFKTLPNPFKHDIEANCGDKFEHPLRFLSLLFSSHADYVTQALKPPGTSSRFLLCHFCPLTPQCSTNHSKTILAKLYSLVFPEVHSVGSYPGRVPRPIWFSGVELWIVASTAHPVNKVSSMVQFSRVH